MLYYLPHTTYDNSLLLDPSTFQAPRQVVAVQFISYLQCFLEDHRKLLVGVKPAIYAFPSAPSMELLQLLKSQLVTVLLLYIFMARALIKVKGLPL
jgi:hypothetical protein